MHCAQFVDQVIVGGLKRIKVVLEGRRIFPILKIEQLKNVTNVVLLVQGLSFEIWEGFQDFANSTQMLNKLLRESLLSELWELTGQAQCSEVLQVYTGLHQIDERLHGLRVDARKQTICSFNVLDVLPLIILKLADQFFFEGREIVGAQLFSIIILLQVLEDAHERLFTGEMILVRRVCHFI